MVPMCRNLNKYLQKEWAPVVAHSELTDSLATLYFVLTSPKSLNYRNAHVAPTVMVYMIRSPLWMCICYNESDFFCLLFILIEFHKSVWPASGVPTLTYSISQECTRCVSLYIDLVITVCYSASQDFLTSLACLLLLAPCCCFFDHCWSLIIA